MIAMYLPFLVPADFYTAEAFHPRAGDEAVVDMESALLFPIVVVRWPRFTTFGLFMEGMVSTDKAEFGQ